VYLVIARWDLLGQIEQTEIAKELNEPLFWTEFRNTKETGWNM
jgi:hypothetical protein